MFDNLFPMKLTLEGDWKKFRSPNYNYDFNLKDGYFRRWGKTLEEDPSWSPFGPELADVEITTGCPFNCAICYKGNLSTQPVVNMSLDTFKQIFAKYPKYDGIPFLTQIAFGITNLDANPDLPAIFKFCRENTVIPNLTVSGKEHLTDAQVRFLVENAGAVAVSVYGNLPKEERYRTLKQLSKAGVSQLNIHYVISSVSINHAYEICNDLLSDPELSNVNAIVFLGLKPKNRGQSYSVVDLADHTKLIDYCMSKGVRFGADSCSCSRVAYAINNNPNLTPEQKKAINQVLEPCESGLFSSYIAVDGKYWHCSFGEDNKQGYGISILDQISFIDVWLSEPMREWRKKLFVTKRQCPLYPELHV